MVARAFTLAMVLITAACAPSLESFNKDGGVIRHTQAGTNMAGVQAMADKYCGQSGKSARITSTDIVWSDDVAFDCVEPVAGGSR